MSSGRVGLGIGLVVVVMGLAWASGAVASGEECRDDWCPRPGAVHERTESCESYCTRFSACSIDRNLAAASGEELERYRAEKAEDGREYADWPAPAVELPAVRGGHLSLAGLLDSRMVPSAFLIDADGRIRQKLVGLKDEATLARAIEGLQAS